MRSFYWQWIKHTVQHWGLVWNIATGLGVFVPLVALVIPRVGALTVAAFFWQVDHVFEALRIAIKRPHVVNGKQFSEIAGQALGGDGGSGVHESSESSTPAGSAGRTRFFPTQHQGREVITTEKS